MVSWTVTKTVRTAHVPPAIKLALPLMSTLRSDSLMALMENLWVSFMEHSLLFPFSSKLLDTTGQRDRPKKTTVMALMNQKKGTRVNPR